MVMASSPPSRNQLPRSFQVQGPATWNQSAGAEPSPADGGFIWKMGGFKDFDKDRIGMEFRDVSMVL